MRCNKCGEKLKKGDSYCPICGEKYVEPEKAVPKKNKVFIYAPNTIDIVLWVFADVYLILILPGLIGYFLGKVFVLLGITVFVVMAVPIAMFLLPFWISVEFIDGKQIKVVNYFKRKTEVYEISNIGYVTDFHSEKTDYPASMRKPTYLVYSKSGMLLFKMRNCYELYKLFDYYGIEMRIHHGV